jgi:prepilin-type N-terminal cleavage/methylation domain-containing protein
MNAHPKTREGGVTLVELAVVLSLLGVLAGFATPMLLTYWQTVALQTGAREVAGAIGLARQLAVSRRTTVCVDAGSDGLRLRLGGCHGVAWTGPLSDSSGMIALSDRASLQLASNAKVVFTPLGAATPSGTYTLTHARTRASRAVVVAGSGRVSVQ